MTDNNRNGFPELEEKLRRSMPVLKVPESLSAAAVAERLKKASPKRKTPIYIYLRNAVAAVLILAVGFWTVRASVVIFGGGMKKADEGYGSESYDITETAPEGNTAAGTDSSDDGVQYSYNSYKDRENSAVITASEDIVLKTGESVSIALSVGYDGITAGPAKDGQQVCVAELKQADDGSSVVTIEGVSPGTSDVCLLREEITVFIFRVTVTE